ncbi:GAF domain-containing protein [Salinifilum ghardaiensis]
MRGTDQGGTGERPGQGHLLRQVHDDVLSGRRAAARPRDLVHASWQRSLAAEVDPDAEEPPVALNTDQLLGVRDRHPLSRSVPTFRQMLFDSVGDMPYIMIVTDEQGTILWREGHSRVCRAADRVLLSEGTRWSENVIGTNAMGTALATGDAVQIHSAEHLVRTYHAWTCAASPIRDPETGRLLGVLDISGPAHTAHPALRALVTASARLAEGRIEQDVRLRDERIRERHRDVLRAQPGEPAALLSSTGRVIESGPGDLALPERVLPDGSSGAVVLADGREAVVEPLDEGYLLRVPQRSRRQGGEHPVLRLRLLGRGRPTAELDGRAVPLGMRHAELLTALAVRQDGVNAERLALLVHGERGNPVTVRAEIHRLRAHLGGDLVRTKPYRLDAQVRADFQQVREALRRGEVREAFELHGAGLLPDSEAPGIVAEREDLAVGVRTAVLHSEDPDLLWDYVTGESGAEDVEALERLRRLLPAGDWRGGSVRARLARAEGAEA